MSAITMNDCSYKIRPYAGITVVSSSTRRKAVKILECGQSAGKALKIGCYNWTYEHTAKYWMVFVRIQRRRRKLQCFSPPKTGPQTPMAGSTYVQRSSARCH